MDNKQQNIDIVKRFLNEVWNEGRESTIDELYAPEGIAKGLGKEHEAGPEQFKAFHQLMHATCEHIHVVPIIVVAEGDMVLYHSLFKMTHKASGKEFRMEAGGSGRIKNGKIVEAHNVVGFLDMLIALGAVPADILPKTLLETKKAETEEV